MKLLQKQNEITIVAGTFSYLHRGHIDLLNRAIKTGKYIIVGITSEEYAKMTKHYEPPSYDLRVQGVEDYLTKRGAKFAIKKLENNQGDSTTKENYSTIVVSEETKMSALTINKKRVLNGLKPLKVAVVRSRVADDGFILSSTRISNDEIDRTGKRLIPLKIVIIGGLNMDEKKILRSIHIFFKDVPLNYKILEKTIASFENSDDVKRDYLSEIKTNDYLFMIRELFESSNFSNILNIKIECTILDKNGYLTTGYSSTRQLNPSQIKYIKRMTESKKLIKLLDGKNLKAMIKESIDSSMYSRLHPGDFNMMGFIDTE